MDRGHHQQYSCPMHPEVIKDAPGKCPKCGMKLVPVNVKASKPKAKHENSVHGQTAHMPEHDMSSHDHKGNAGHAHHAGMIGDFKKRF
jgi:Cu2+-exporting ATPase